MGRSSAIICNVRFLWRITKYWESGEKQLNSRGISSQDLRHCRFLQKVQDDLQKRNIEPEKSTDRIIFMSMFNDVDSTREGIDEICVSDSEKVKTYAKKFSQGHWTFLGPGDEKKWCEKSKYPPEGKWNSVASQVVQRFKRTGHPVFTSASALSRGFLRMLKVKETIHFNADASNTELFFRIIHLVNQLSIYEAVSGWCEQVGLIADEKGQERILEKGESVNKEMLKSVNSQEVNSLVSCPRLASGNRLRENVQDFETLSETIHLIKVCELASFCTGYRLV